MTNNNTDEKIIIQNNQGTADDSINIKSYLGGITLNSSTISLDGGVVSSGTLVKKTGVSTINTSGNSTLTIDMLMGGLILRDPNSDNREDTLPTAESIVGSISGAVVGSSFEFRIKNTDTNASHNITISSANGVTTNGTMTIEPSYIRTFLVVGDNVTFNNEAVTIYSLGTLAP